MTFKYTEEQLNKMDKNLLIQLFMGNHGATSSAIIYSIAETAKANNLKPYEYFEYLLTKISKHVEDKKKDFLEELLPWSETLPEHLRKPKTSGDK